MTVCGMFGESRQPIGFLQRQSVGNNAVLISCVDSAVEFTARCLHKGHRNGAVVLVLS